MADDKYRSAHKRYFIFTFVAAVVLVATTAIVPFAFRHPHSAVARPPAGDKEAELVPPEAREIAVPLGPWQSLGRKTADGIQGYAGRVSVVAGDELPVYVSTHARTYSTAVYRMGYYNGTGARLMARYRGLRGTTQAACPREALGMIECRWRRSFLLRTPVSWPSGVYAIKLVGSDRTQSFVPFVLRERVPRAPILFQVSVATWQAYNSWGHYDLYQGPCVVPGTSPSPSPSHTQIRRVAFVQRVRPQLIEGVRRCEYENRARAVSFDRPYSWPGMGQFFRFEYPMLYWLEENGYHVAYATDVDLHEGLESLASRRIFIAAGHDEYYSLQMRRALEQALAHGTNLIFMGADDIYRHIRFEASPLGPDRIEVNYKIAAEDPLSATDPLDSTAQWRAWPTKDPEQRLLGAQYDCNPVTTSWVPTGKPAWLFRRTGLVPGRGLPRLVGYEYDRVFGNEAHPPGVIDVARSPLVCDGRASESDSTFYVAPSRAGVFDAGTLDLVCALGRSPHACGGINEDTRIERMMSNLIAAMMLKRFR